MRIDEDDMIDFGDKKKMCMKFYIYRNFNKTFWT